MNLRNACWLDRAMCSIFVEDVHPRFIQWDTYFGPFISFIFSLDLDQIDMSIIRLFLSTIIHQSNGVVGFCIVQMNLRNACWLDRAMCSIFVEYLHPRFIQADHFYGTSIFSLDLDQIDAVRG